MHTLEGKIVRLSDKIAYINSDIDDAIRAGIISDGVCPRSCPSATASVKSSLSRSALAIVLAFCATSSVCVSRVL